MRAITAKKLYYSIIIFMSIITIYLIILNTKNEIQIYPRTLEGDQLQSWLEKKQKLNKTVKKCFHNCFLVVLFFFSDQ